MYTPNLHTSVTSVLFACILCHAFRVCRTGGQSGHIPSDNRDVDPDGDIDIGYPLRGGKMALDNRKGIKNGRMNHLIHRVWLDRAEASVCVCIHTVLATIPLYVRKRASLFRIPIMMDIMDDGLEIRNYLQFRWSPALICKSTKQESEK